MNRSVRIFISRRIDKLITLGKAVFKKHDELGGASPLNGLANIPELPGKIENAEEFLTQARELHAQAEALTEKAKTILGIGKGQSIKNPKGTVLNTVGRARNQLKITHEGEEEQISEYGYNVVVK